MSSYVILDYTANLVESFDDQQEAVHALEQIIEQDADAADGYALIEYDDEGHPVGDALIGSELHAPA